jgi:virginiamycin B lyase
MSRRSVLAGTLLFSLVAFPSPSLSQAPALPDGAGRELVEAMCTGCHQINQITRSAGYTDDGWRELAATMIDLSGAPEDQAEIVAYLAENFVPNDRRAPTLIAGDAEISFTEWVAPTLGQRARDPVDAADGSIWWAGQWASLVGRIDPATGEMTEYPLPPEARPHSVNIDQDGNVWYTGNGNGTIGKLDPKTGEIVEYPMPDAAARDPHTAEFDADGILWFTLQQSNMVGRLDPKTGDVKLTRMKTDRARPYGIKIAEDGTPWVACNGSNCLVRIKPETMEPTEIELPLEGTTVRRLDIAGDGTVWYVNSSEGRLGRFDPETGEIKEWPSPSGPDSHPYAIAIVDGIVWYNESGKRPDALVRFDPASETFQSWAIPSGNIHAGIVRHMRPASDGSLLIHQSSTNRIIRATPSVAMD